MSLGQVVRISKGRAKNFGLCPSRNEDAPPPPPCLQLALKVTVASPMHQASTLPCLGPCHWYSLDANSSHFSPFSHLFNSTVFQRHCPCASRCHVPIASTAITLWCHSSLVWKWADHVSLKKKSWSRVDLQCCICFWCTAKWFSFIHILVRYIYISYICILYISEYTYTHYFGFFTITHYYKILNIVPCAI